jgi:ABC-type branched-subunit amino acid transport system substrate-binding protein
MKRSRLAYAALAATAAVGLAACTSSGGGSNAASTTGAAGTTGANSPSPSPTFTGEIKIGEISEVSMTSVMGNAEPHVGHALQASIDAINAAGGVNGKKVVLQVCDEKANANGAAQCARDLVAAGVVADVGDASTFGTQISPIFQQAGIPRIAPLALSAAEYNSPGNYPLNGGAVVMFQGAAVYAANTGAKSIYLVYTEAEGSSAVQGFVSMVYKSHNLEDKGSEGIPPQAADLSSYVTKAMNSGADVVLTTFGPDMTEQFAKTAVQLGAKFKIATVADSFGTAVVQAVGKDQPIVQTALLTSPFPPVTDNSIQGIKLMNQQLDAAQSQYPDLKAENRTILINPWLAGNLFGQIAKSVTGDVTAASMTAAVKSAKDLDTLGLMPPWTPSAKGGILANVSNGTGWFIKIDSNGTQVLANPAPQPILSAIASGS